MREIGKQGFGYTGLRIDGDVVGLHLATGEFHRFEVFADAFEIRSTDRRGIDVELAPIYFETAKIVKLFKRESEFLFCHKVEERTSS